MAQPRVRLQELGNYVAWGIGCRSSVVAEPVGELGYRSSAVAQPGDDGCKSSVVAQSRGSTVGARQWRSQRCRL